MIKIEEIRIIVNHSHSHKGNEQNNDNNYDNSDHDDKNNDNFLINNDIYYWLLL